MFKYEERLDPDRYYAEHYATFSQYLGRYAFASRFADADAAVLDLGCGCGYGAAYLAEAPNRSVVGIDRSSEGTGFARKRYGLGRLSFVTADATAIPLKSGTMNLIVAMEMIEHVRDAKAVINEVRRVLKPGGLFVVSTPNRLITGSGDIPDNPFHVKEYSPKEFMALLQDTFSQAMLYGHALTPACRVNQENMQLIWHNLSLIPVLYDQLHTLRARLEMDERISGLALLRKWKRKLFGGRHHRKQDAMPDLNQAFRHAHYPVTSMADWDISPYQIDAAPVLLAVCMKS